MSEIKVCSPESVDESGWRRMYDNAKFAVDAAMEIDPVAYLGEFEQFHELHLFPQRRVGTTDNFNQEYHHPRVAVDEDYNWAYAEHNVSHGLSRGPQDDSPMTEAIRTLKRISGIVPFNEIHVGGRDLRLNRNYFHLREDYVHPSQQHEGRAHALIRRVGRTAIPFQPWAVYVYPGIYKEGVASPVDEAVKYGFVPGEPQPVEKSGRKIDMVRMQAPGHIIYPKIILGR